MANVLEQRQSKNDTIWSMRKFILKIAAFFHYPYRRVKNPANSKLICLSTKSSRSYIVLDLNSDSNTNHNEHTVSTFNDFLYCQVRSKNDFFHFSNGDYFEQRWYPVGGSQAARTWICQINGTNQVNKISKHCFCRNLFANAIHFCWNRFSP